MSFYLGLFSHIDKEVCIGMCQSWVVLKNFGELKDGQIRVSPSCYSLLEVESAVFGLKKELDAILKQARRKYAEAAKIKERGKSTNK